MGLLIVKDMTNTNKVIAMPGEYIHGVEMTIHESTTAGQTVSVYINTRHGRFGEKKRDQSDAQVEAAKELYAGVLDLMAAKRDLVNLSDFEYEIPAKKKGSLKAADLVVPEPEPEPSPPEEPEGDATESEADTEAEDAE